MKLKYLLFLLPISLSILASCGSEDSTNGKNKTEGIKGDETAKKECRIASASYSIGDKKKVLLFNYKDGNLKTVDTEMNGELLNQTMAFNFHDHGGIQAFLSGLVIAAYVYDDDNKILKINGEKGLNTRVFEYNENGQMSKEMIMFQGIPYMTYEYEYDKKGQPTVVSMYDKKRDLMEVNTIKYDDKINPFANTGTFVNNMEKMLGYPVGNHVHNVTSIKKEYKNKVSFQVDGEDKINGDVDENIIEYKYNENDYPVSLSIIRKGAKTTMTIEYTCE